jgi:hypothetical protein
MTESKPTGATPAQAKRIADKIADEKGQFYGPARIAVLDRHAAEAAAKQKGAAARTDENLISPPSAFATSSSIGGHQVSRPVWAGRT